LPSCSEPSPPPTLDFPSWTHTIGEINTLPQFMNPTNCFDEN
jgi:hypothetical protein